MLLMIEFSSHNGAKKMKKIIAGAIAMFFAMMPIANADQALIIDAGLDKGSEYTGVVGTAGVKWKF